MGDLERVELLLDAIMEKHRTACTFTVQRYTSESVYQTYIADDVFPAHQKHESLDDAIARLDIFLAIDDLEAHNDEIAMTKIQRLREQQEDIGDEIQCLERKLSAKEVE